MSEGHEGNGHQREIRIWYLNSGVLGCSVKFRPFTRIKFYASY
jgi:hypothetical protein